MGNIARADDEEMCSTNRKIPRCRYMFDLSFYFFPLPFILYLSTHEHNGNLFKSNISVGCKMCVAMQTGWNVMKWKRQRVRERMGKNSKRKVERRENYKRLCKLINLNWMREQTHQPVYLHRLIFIHFLLTFYLNFPKLCVLCSRRTLLCSKRHPTKWVGISCSHSTILQDFGPKAVPKLFLSGSSDLRNAIRRRE